MSTAGLCLSYSLSLRKWHVLIQSHPDVTRHFQGHLVSKQMMWAGEMALWRRAFALQACGSGFKSQHPYKNHADRWTREAPAKPDWAFCTPVHFLTLILIHAHSTLKVQGPKTQVEAVRQLLLRMSFMFQVRGETRAHRMLVCIEQIFFFFFC